MPPFFIPENAEANRDAARHVATKNKPLCYVPVDGMLGHWAHGKMTRAFALGNASIWQDFKMVPVLVFEECAQCQ